MCLCFTHLQYVSKCEHIGAICDSTTSNSRIQLEMVADESSSVGYASGEEEEMKGNFSINMKGTRGTAKAGEKIEGNLNANQK